MPAPLTLSQYLIRHMLQLPWYAQSSHIDKIEHGHLMSIIQKHDIQGQMGELNEHCYHRCASPTYT